MFERMALNWKLAVSSLKVLLHNKRLLIFPVMKVIYCGALYQYAALGTVPEGFDARCFEKAFSK